MSERAGQSEKVLDDALFQQGFEVCSGKIDTGSKELPGDCGRVPTAAHENTDRFPGPSLPALVDQPDDVLGLALAITVRHHVPGDAGGRIRFSKRFARGKRDGPGKPVFPRRERLAENAVDPRDDSRIGAKFRFQTQEVEPKPTDTVFMRLRGRYR